MEWFKHSFEDHLSLYDLTPKAAFLGFTEKHLDDNILQNHLLLDVKLYLYKSRSHGPVCLKVQSCKLYCSKYMIASTQITNTEVFALIAVLISKLFSRKILFIKEKTIGSVKM